MVVTSDSSPTVTALARELGITQQRLSRLLAQGRVVGAWGANGRWHIPTPVTITRGKRPLAKVCNAMIVEAPKMPPLPHGQFRCHVIDPPWPMAKIRRVVRPNQVEMDYPVMSVADILRLPVGAKSESSGSHLYLWTTQRFLPDALDIAKAWGFRYQCLLTWVKNGGITPYSWQYNTEHVVFATKGDLALNRLGLKLSFNGDRREHSRKPESFYDLVMKASPGPRLEWFSRQPREGFVTWGGEKNRFDAET